MDARYAIADTRGIFSPGLVIFRDLVEKNLDEMIRVAGSAARLRPHCKTHKMREIAQMQLTASRSTNVRRSPRRKCWLRRA